MPATYDNSVFLNCPFDPAYRPLFEAVVFAVYDCGFVPRCAMEADDGSQVRIEKITRIIRECRLAIHDISRTELDAVHRLPRFNMPFELGIFVGAKAFGSSVHRRKACLVLDGERYRYQKFLSDIAGQDIREHGSTEAGVIRQVRDFLSLHLPADTVLPGGTAVLERYGTFRRKLAETCAELRVDEPCITFRDLTVLTVGWLSLHPLGHHVAVPAAA